MSKPKSNNRRSKVDSVQTDSVTVKDFGVGSRVRVSSTHPIFPGVICIVSALPSPDAAIVELEDGARERLLLKDIKTLEPEPTSNSTGVRFEILEELTLDEQRERHRLELKVQRAFYEAGTGLRDLRDKRLYRSTHKTFEDYCFDRFGFARRRPYQLIEAVSVVDNLCTNSSQNGNDENLCTNCTQILPTNEGQVRPLTKLHPEEQRAAWQQAIDLADGKVPTGRIVKGVVERLLEKPLFLASDYCKLGEVFFLTRLCGEECKYNGCWAIAIEVENRFTVKAATYKGDLEVKQENIKRIDSQQTGSEIREIHQRLKRLIECPLDPIDEAQIEILCRRSWFTQRQKDALTTLEKVYKVK